MATNALGQETSPYLLQHADNPVKWYPWGEEALALARELDKPILLSIGYSACHWCHVMAHESFEDEHTAALMNKHFVNIKVDREERPDLDKIYQVAHQLLTRNNGGWPLTMFLTPDDHTPFFGGTYFPKEPRFGMLAFEDLIQRVTDFYRERTQDIRAQNESLRDALQQMQQHPSTNLDNLDDTPLRAARQASEDHFDPKLGGFGGAPKFPHPTGLERLLRDYAGSTRNDQPDPDALHMALFTLRRMALGGIRDHLGGGFCRYSVDAHWMIPHFEKMLYDNGPLLRLYSEAWQISGDPLFKTTALETADWVLREMQAPQGGYYSSLDADSEGEEGKFYVWTRPQLDELLGPEDAALIGHHFGVDNGLNFEGSAHFYVSTPSATCAQKFALSAAQCEARIANAKAKLLAARSQRVWPARDDKILTSWNALMIKGLASAGRIFQRTEYIDSAAAGLDFLRAQMWDGGVLLATYKDGKAHLNAYLDDYAFLLDACLSLLQARWRSDDLNFAIALAQALLAKFQDSEKGGFFFTSHDHEILIQRSKSFFDEALPAGNGIAAQALLRLGHLLGESRYLEAAANTLAAASTSIQQMPSAHNALLNALEEFLQPPEIIVLRGGAEELALWQQRCNTSYAPHRLTVSIPDDAADLPGILQQRASSMATTAYLCRGHQCDPPISDFAELDRQLQAGEILRTPR